MTNSPTLSIVIPIWNRPDELKALLKQVAQIGLFHEVLVCDDGSEVSCDPAKLSVTQESLGAILRYLPSSQQKGAGNARNRGLQAVSTDYVLFFDSDDFLEPGLADAWDAVKRHAHDLPNDAAPLDFAIFRHADTRVRKLERREGSFDHDERLWDQVLMGRDNQLLSKSDRAELCTIAAYPWNKIYRTDFLKEKSIRCTETPVHNDIELHWNSFICAKKVLALDIIGATHVVDPGQQQLTNRKSEQRFCVFRVFSEVLERARSVEKTMLFRSRFIRFSYDLCRWIDRNLDDQLRDRFSNSVRDFFSQQISIEEFTDFAFSNPDTARRMTGFLAERGAL